ncbi:hypothetical protein [uncultured Streptococcus sp.]|uniref:hypothetical protein n=1 Tax=uncultured Streptococcus sp. TaxID=83427 RepID=UPI0028D863B3|nr:hypothetical protein [uncultured Streptococcus sp.]
MLVDTDSDTKADANSEACLRELDSELLIETDLEFNSDSDVLAEMETLIDSEANSDTDAD